MTGEENDPDKLQLLDELDSDWVKLWRNAANKKEKAKNELTFSVSLHEKISQTKK